MTGEIITKVVEAEAKNAVKEISKEIGNKVDITKRIDNHVKQFENDKQKVDITKRIIPDKNITESIKNLLPEQVNNLLDAGVSPGIIKDMVYDDGIYKLKTVNNDLVDKEHPETGIKYIKKIVDILGVKIEGVFPQFNSLFDTKLPKDKLLSTDSVQFNYCTERLQNAIKNDKKLRKKFSETQTEQIENGKVPRGYVWHHNEELGKMELVKADIHDKAKHTGGKAIWGGGRTRR